MDIKEQFDQMAAAKRAEIQSTDGKIAEVKDQLARLVAENKANETMAAEFDKLSTQYAKK